MKSIIWIRLDGQMNRSLLVAGLLYGCGWSIIDEIRIPRIRLQLVAIVAPFIGSKNNECDTQRSVKFSAQLSRDTNTIQKICYANNHQFSSGNKWLETVQWSVWSQIKYKCNLVTSMQEYRIHLSRGVGNYLHRCFLSDASASFAGEHNLAGKSCFVHQSQRQYLPSAFGPGSRSTSVIPATSKQRWVHLCNHSQRCFSLFFFFTQPNDKAKYFINKVLIVFRAHSALKNMFITFHFVSSLYGHRSRFYLYVEWICLLKLFRSVVIIFFVSLVVVRCVQFLLWPFIIYYVQRAHYHFYWFSKNGTAYIPRNGSDIEWKTNKDFTFKCSCAVRLRMGNKMFALDITESYIFMECKRKPRTTECPNIVRTHTQTYTRARNVKRVSTSFNAHLMHARSTRAHWTLNVQPQYEPRRCRDTAMPSN